LKSLPSLEVLNLDECVQLQDNALEQIAESCGNLKKI